MQICSVELLDRILRFLFVRHLDEGESARLTRVTVTHQLHSFNLAELREHLLQILLTSRKCQIPNVDTLHFRLLLCLGRQRIYRKQEVQRGNGRRGSLDGSLASQEVANTPNSSMKREG